MGGVRLATVGHDPGQGLAMTEAGADAAAARRSFAVAAFNAAWELVDKEQRSPAEDRQMLTLACASRWHWSEVGTAENIAIADWQVAHVASLIGEPSLALAFAQTAYDAAHGDELPDWLCASTAEGLARAYACAGDRASYERFRDEARELVDKLEEEEDRELILGQLASIPMP